MILQIGAIRGGSSSDYPWILAQLRKYGLTPSGDENIDRARVKEAQRKEEEKFVIEKIENYFGEEKENTFNEREIMEQEKIGAMNVAQINRILLGI